jgi:hypothetical protein
MRFACSAVSRSIEIEVTINVQLGEDEVTNRILKGGPRVGDFVAAALGVVMCVLASSPGLAAERCGPGANGVMFVTPDCVDPEYNDGTIVLDRVTQEITPEPYTRVQAHFPPTATKPRYEVILALPPGSKFHGRFFQHTYPLPQGDAMNPTNARVRDLSFSFASGGYYLKQVGDLQGLSGYRPGAAAAKWARNYAATFYKRKGRIYGYLFGGSGGSFQTLGAMESTKGVWDGAVPYVMGSDITLVNAGVFASFAALALNDRLPAIAEAVKPGGSGDPFAGLNADQREALTEILHAGYPLRALDIPPFPALAGLAAMRVRAADPSYAEDFWTKPGYEGSNPPAYLAAAKFDKSYRVTGTDPSGALILDSVPDFATVSSSKGAGISYSVYDASGKLAGVLAVPFRGALNGNVLKLSPEAAAANAPLVRTLLSGGKLRVDNLWYLALSFYPRHALPADRGYYTYTALRKADGTPRYPQRSVDLSDAPNPTTGGAHYTGKINGKVILVSNLLDNLAYPWHADWYSAKVRSAIGVRAWADNLRIQYTDHADHIDNFDVNSDRMVDYNPMLYQSLRDLAAWVEQGVPAPASTRYEIVNVGQVKVPGTASARGGIQPVVSLTSAGGQRVEVAANQPVTLTIRADTPPGGGRVVKLEASSGDGPVAFRPIAIQPGVSIRAQVTFTYSKPGTYFPVVRASSQREGDPHDLVQIPNLDRVRVVVR